MPEDIEMLQGILDAITAFVACRGLAIEIYVKIVGITSPETDNYTRILGLIGAVLEECDRTEQQAVFRYSRV